LTANRDVSRAAPALFLTSRFAPFDGLRAVAVLLVFGHHLMGRYVPGGWIGVELFFGLSGFLITSLLLREHENKGRIDLRAFFARRALRLVPALVVHVAIVTPLAILAGVTGVIPAAVAALTYTTDFYAILGGDSWIFAHTWSLTVEEQFYLVWPVVLIPGLARGWRLLRGLAAVAVLGVVGGAAIAATVSTHVAYATPFSHLPTILGGAALAYAVQRGAVRLERFGTIWIPVVAGVVMLSTTFLVDQFTESWLYYGGMVALCAPLVLLVAHLCAKPDGPLAKALTQRPLVWLGERSYGFYLWHYPVSAAAHQLGINRPVAGLLAVAVTVGLTELSWRLVELPFLRMKRRYA
jgi:peptidoglycan/LPS O-acetylase OafA/YrhL